jgi:hypothetical protein
VEGDFESLAAVKRGVALLFLFIMRTYRRGSAYGTRGLGVMVMFLSWNASASLPQSVHSIGFAVARAGAAVSGSSTMTVTRSGLAAARVEKSARGGTA